jgi:hypothetical protein
MDLASDRRAWVKRVLGVDPPPSPTAAPQPLAVIWNTAKEQVDQQIASLCGAMRDVDHRLVASLAGGALAAYANGLVVKLTASLLSIDQARGGDPASRGKLAAETAAHVAQMRGSLDANRALRLIEDNPFGVSAPVRETLLSALTRIGQSLAT